MRFALALCLIGFGILTAHAQTSPSSVCSTAVGFCIDSSYSYTRGTSGTAEAGPDYTCSSGTDKNPSWFYMQVKNSGNIVFTINTLQANDTRFILWGPFSYPFSNCGANLSAAKKVDCGKTTVTIPSAVSGDYYILLLTNNSGNASGITFTQTSGTGSSNCDVLCNLTGLTAAASACQGGANLGTYNITGTVTTQSPPSSGTLTITSSCGASVSFNAPFSTSINYTLPYKGGYGSTCTVTAVYSANTNCTKSTTVSTPTCCTLTTPSSSVSVCESQTLSLQSTGTSGGTYAWTGPSGFSSTLQNPSISKILTSQAGTYQVSLTYGGCTPSAVSVNVTVKSKPSSKSIIHR
jgi:hypothetical protein